MEWNNEQKDTNEEWAQPLSGQSQPQSEILQAPSEQPQPPAELPQNPPEPPQFPTEPSWASSEPPQPPPQYCARCGSVLHGRFCGRCGMAEGAAFYSAPPQYTAPPPQYSAFYGAPQRQPEHKSGKTALIVTIIILSVLLLFSSCVTLFFVAENISSPATGDNPFASDIPPDDYYGYEDDFGYDYGYDFGYGYDYEYGFHNETEYVRVEALNTVRGSGSEAYPAPAGKEYLIASLRVTNLDSDFYPYDTIDFELLLGGNGNLLPALVTDIDSTTALGSGRLLPGGHVEGTVVFLVPKGELNLVLFMSDYEGPIQFPLL